MKNSTPFTSLKLPLLFTDYLVADRFWHYEDVMSPFSRIMIVIGGEASVCHSGQEFRLEAGRMLLVPKYTLSNYRCTSQMEHYYILFNDEMFEGGGIYDLQRFNYLSDATEREFDLARRLLELNPARQLPHLNPKYYDNSATLYDYVRKNEMQNPGDLIETHGILLQLFSRFTFRDQPTELPAAQNQFAEIMRYIDINLHTPLSITDIASRANLCPEYFSRRFKKITGLKPVEYINRRRIERAKQMLLTPNTSIRQIASRVGIENYTYFFSLFKHYAGCSPIQYAKSLLKE